MSDSMEKPQATQIRTRLKFVELRDNLLLFSVNA